MVATMKTLAWNLVSFVLQNSGHTKKKAFFNIRKYLLHIKFKRKRVNFTSCEHMLNESSQIENNSRQHKGE